MPTTDEELLKARDEANGPAKDLYDELLEARKALAIAKKITSIGPMLSSSIYTMELQGCKKSELQLAVIHKKPDGSGRVGPMWELGEFVENMEELAKLLHTKDEHMELSAMGIASIFGGGAKNEP